MLSARSYTARTRRKGQAVRAFSARTAISSRRLRVIVLGLGLGLALELTMVPGRTGAAATATFISPASSAASATPAAGASASSAGAPAASQSAPALPAAKLDRAEIIAYLDQVIGWRRQIDMAIRPSNAPEETLFAADDRRMADEVVKLAFDFARAAVALVPTEEAGAGASGAAGGPSALNQLAARRNELSARLAALQSQEKDLQTRTRGGSRAARELANRELGAVQAESDLLQSRIASFDTIIDFEKGTAPTRAAPLRLSDQIDELEQSVQRSGVIAQAAVSPASRSSSAILPDAVEQLFVLRRKARALSGAIELSHQLAGSIAQLRNALVKMLAAIDRQGLTATAQLGGTDPLTSQRAQNGIRELAHEGRIISNAVPPLSKQLVILKFYSENLLRWRNNVRQEFNLALRRVFFRTATLTLLLAAVFIGSSVWGRLTFRYVEDIHRRQQLLRFRRVVVIGALALVLMFGFSSELSTLATIMGFAAAGIALALQNVIISLAGYFYLSGRFGLRIGDRVQIAGVNGDILEIGFFKMTLMELTGDDGGRQPTGRAVIFPNSVVFQPNSNFFRQLPGTSFTWDELHLSISADFDYRIAEQKLNEVVNETFARYRDAVQREYRALESNLNVPIEIPRPQSRLHFGAAGLELVIRYPTRLNTAVQTADDITRRIVDAIRGTPGLRIVPPGIPIIQADPGQMPAPSPAGSPDGQRPPAIDEGARTTPEAEADRGGLPDSRERAAKQ